jgi:hypothetical protein
MSSRLDRPRERLAYPADTDASTDPLGIRHRVQATGRRMTLGMVAEHRVAALLVSLAVEACDQ